MMKRALFSALVLVVACTGCQQGQHAPQAYSAVKVTVEGRRDFPKFLVGTWRAERVGWQFVFEPDGTISSAVIDDGLVEVRPSERRATAELKEGGHGFYELGQWSVHYTEATHRLRVEVVVENFELNMVTFGLTGFSIDVFEGPVSEEELTWQADRYSTSHTIAFDPSKRSHEQVTFDSAAEGDFVGTLIFRKLQQSQ